MAAAYRAIEVVDGLDAPDRFAEHRTEIDILATDVVMSKMNGKILYEKIRKIRSDMKALYMSGYTKDIIVGMGIMDDEFSFITNPVVTHELLIGIRGILY